jgi:hypothetical protein
MTLNVSPQIEAKLVDAARLEGVDPGILVEKLVTEYRPASSSRQATPSIDPENDASIALLESWIAGAPTDPDAIREAEEDLAELKRNMNRPRKESGARILFPEVETE